MHNMAIVGTFYDGYYDLWEDFLNLLTYYWPDCPYPVYIVNDMKELNFDKKYNVTVYHAGENAKYSQRVQTALREIEAEYYLLLLEDFFIGEKLQASVLEDILTFMKENDAKYYRMPTRDFIPFYKKQHIEKIKPQMEYTVSCQPSIWKKDFLRKCIGVDKYNAWVFEGIYSKAPVAHTEVFLKGCYCDYRNVLCLYHGVLQSKFQKKTVKYFRNNGYEFKTKIPLMDKKDEIKYVTKRLMNDLCPLKIRKIIKMSVKTGSVVDRYSDEVDYLIKKMGLSQF